MTEVFDEANRSHNHLLIAASADSRESDYVFISDGPGVIRFGHFAGPTLELTSEQLRVIGEYCLRQADRLDAQR